MRKSTTGGTSALVALLVLALGCAEERAANVGSAPADVGSALSTPGKRTLKYVHLGDSYAAGTGAGDIYWGPLRCFRSRNSFAELWAADSANQCAVELKNESCSGAQIATVSADQLSQLSAETDRVSLVIGGNDVQFVDLIKACRTPIGDCAQANDTSRALIDSVLGDRLTALLLEIANRAPNAKILLGDYPIPYNADSDCPFAISKDDRAMLNETVRRLNVKLIDVVNSLQNQGYFQFGLREVSGNFEGHRLCDDPPDGERWINDLLVETPGVDSGAGVYHANSVGHRKGYLPAFSDYPSDPLDQCDASAGLVADTSCGCVPLTPPTEAPPCPSAPGTADGFSDCAIPPDDGSGTGVGYSIYVRTEVEPSPGSAGGIGHVSSWSLFPGASLRVQHSTTGCAAFAYPPPSCPASYYDDRDSVAVYTPDGQLSNLVSIRVEQGGWPGVWEDGTLFVGSWWVAPTE